MMAALGTVIMLTGGIVPVFTYCSPLLAALLLIPVMIEYGNVKAGMVWIITSALSLLIGLDKEAGFFYLFLGWYPIFKPFADRIPGRALRILIKAAVLTAAVTAMYGLICFVFRIGEIMESFSASAWINTAFLAALVIVMLMYDTVLVKAAVIYVKKLRPFLTGSGLSSTGDGLRRKQSFRKKR